MNSLKMDNGNGSDAMPPCGNFTAPYGMPQQQQQPPMMMPPSQSTTPTPQQQQQYMMPPQHQQQQPPILQSPAYQQQPQYNTGANNEYAMTGPQQQAALTYLQQQQMNTMPMMPMPSLNLSSNDFSNKSDANIMNNITGQRQPVHMKYDDFRPFEEVRRQYVTDELTDDLEKIRSMTLLDSCNYLDTLYITEMMFVDPKYTIATLLTMYREKYRNLFEKYPSLETFFLVGISFITYRSLLEFKTTVQQSRSGGSGALSIPNVGFKNNRLIGVRQRLLAATRGVAKSAATASSASTSKENGHQTNNQENGQQQEGAENVDIDESKLPAENDGNGDGDEKLLKDHMFVSSPLMARCRIVFEIGKLVNFCIPYDFARIMVEFHKTTVKRYLANKAHEVYRGLRMSFRVPVLTLIRRRVVTKGATYNYANLENLTAVGEMLTYYTGQRLDLDAFALGTRLEMDKIEVELASSSSSGNSDGDKSSASDKSADDLEFTFMSNFDVLATNVGVAGIKGFTNKTYVLRQRSVICPEETVEKFNDMYEVLMKKRTAALEKWYMEKFREELAGRDGGDNLLNAMITASKKKNNNDNKSATPAPENVAANLVQNTIAPDVVAETLIPPKATAMKRPSAVVTVDRGFDDEDDDYEDNEDIIAKSKSESTRKKVRVV